MYGKFRFSMNGFIYFLMWSVFNFNVTCGLCPMVFDSGYIDQSCTSGMACNFFCNPGFVKTNNVLFCMKDEYWFPNTSSVCIKTVYCPAIFNNGYIQSSCSRLPGDSCNFICDPGFVKKGNQLTCGKDGMWIQNTNSICIQSNNCPDEFNGGYIAPTCSRHPGESCNYNCYPGFVKIGYWLICGNNGAWIQDTNSICIKSDPCPEVFNGGNVEPTCSRVLGNSCTFNCNPGFVKKGKLLTCGNFGNWFPDTNSICVQSDTCPETFHGGYIAPFCSRHPGESCTYHCYPRFAKIGYWLTCGNNRTWIQDTNSICIQSDPCPEVFNGGYVDLTCSRDLGSSCTFICNPRFVKKGTLLTCGNFGNWFPDANSICEELDTCPYIFNGGYIQPLCSSLPGESCTFMCYPGFVKVGFSLTCGNNGTWIQDTNSGCIESDPCPEVFNGGYVEPTCSRVLGNSCTFDCNPGFVKKCNLLTCGNFGNWFPDTNSICVQLVEPMPTGPIHFGAIVGISPAEFIIVMIIIVSIVVWRAKRSGVRNSQRVPYHAGATFLNLTTRRQQPNADVINSVSSI